MSFFKKQWRALAFTAAAVGLICLPIGAQPAKTSGTGAAAGTLTDARNGRTYKTVKIGNQTWMAENLNFQTPNGSWCYGNSAANCQKYGRLYDWNTAMAGKASSNTNPSDVQGVCPAGWHLPSSAEWGELAKAAGGTGTVGEVGIAGERLKAKSGGWYMQGNGTDNYGFAALPGGWRDSTGGFHSDRMIGSWWTSTANSKGFGIDRQMGHTDEFVKYGVTNSNKNGFSVRCVMDVAKAKTDSVQQKAEGGGSAGGAAEKGTFTDTRDNKTYKTVKIGGKNWMAENLNYKVGNSFCYGNDDSKCKQYGRLYDWNTAKVACPKGWHLATTDNWIRLVELISYETGGKKLKSTSGWNKNGNGSNEYGFSALPGGMRDSSGVFNGASDSGSIFKGVGDAGFWWEFDKNYKDRNNFWGISHAADAVGAGTDISEGGSSYSVRCVQD